MSVLHLNHFYLTVLHTLAENFANSIKWFTKNCPELLRNYLPQNRECVYLKNKVEGIFFQVRLTQYIIN